VNKPNGRLGVWAALDTYSYDEIGEFARRVEQLGYNTLWVPDAAGRDSFVVLAHIAHCTSTLWGATGIANLYARDAMAMKSARYALAELSGGRFILGLGVSHVEMVSGVRQHDYGKPLSTMGAYLEAMEAALYVAKEPANKGLLLLAALREKMLELAGTAADGAHPYLVTPAHTARAREIVGEGKYLVPEQKVLLENDPAKARDIGRKAMAANLGLRNYQANLLSLGFNERDFADGGSDHLVDSLIAWGDEAAIAARIQAHWDAGADQVCIQALRHDGQVGFDLPTLERLAHLAE
jgi:probable F420-dependent oxidoreductase